MRNTKKDKTQTNISDLPMKWLSNELKDAALQGHVLELKEVWTRYQTISLEAGVEIPKCFLSRLSTFKFL